MKSVLLKRLGLFAVAIGVVFGCNAVVNAPSDSEPAAGSNFGTVESVFTDAPIGSGGTGGVVIEEGDLVGEETRSFFTAFQIDPDAEDSAGPKFIVAGDVDQDGLMDLVTAWNQSQPVQLHLQRRDAANNISFRTVTLGGTSPIAVVAGVQLGQIDDDGWLDVVVLSKATGGTGLCPPKTPGDPPTIISSLEGEIIVLFSPGDPILIPDGDRWREMILVNPFVQDPWIHNQYPGNEEVSFNEGKTKPEWNGFTSLAVGNVDGVPGDDIVVALNPGECETLGQKPAVNTVDLWTNPGPGLADISELWGAPPPGIQTRNVPVTLMADLPQVKQVRLTDVDLDGDLDVIATWTNAISPNIRWARNPLIPHNAGGPGGLAEVISAGAEGFDFCSGGANAGDACSTDADCPGIPDGTCVGGECNGGSTDGSNCTLSSECQGEPAGTCRSGVWRYLADGWQLRPVGQVDTGADIFDLGDIDGDGFEDLVVRSTNGQIVQWFRRPSPVVIAPEFPPNDPVPDRFNFPWPVFTLTELIGQEPEAIALGDVTGDGSLELLMAAEGAVYWLDPTTATTVYDPWAPNMIIQDVTDGGTSTGADQQTTEDPSAPGTGVGVQQVDSSTHINTLLVVDLDGDGKNDVVGTLDRRSGAGLSDDRLVWYRNTLEESDE